jgi:hypothetical protein
MSNLSTLDRYGRDIKIGSNYRGDISRLPGTNQQNITTNNTNNSTKNYNINVNVDNSDSGFNARSVARDIRDELRRLDEIDNFSKGRPI